MYPSTEILRSYETPLYYYDMSVLDDTLNSLVSASGKYGYHVHYAIKANANDRILDRIAKKGIGADCVSGNEIIKSLETGFPNNSIFFAGVGKSDKEIICGLDRDIHCFNCESPQEIEVINQLSGERGKKTRIALRINPDVNPNTHKYITTGISGNKFGINPWRLAEIMDLVNKMENIELIGLHFHIGSQINDLSVFGNLCTRVNEIYTWFVNRKISLEHINLGGGLGIDYDLPNDSNNPNFEDYFNTFDKFLELPDHLDIHFELGRSVVARCGELISRVLFTKESLGTQFIILDAGMTELIRPALYQAYHTIENISSSSGELERYDVVGPICESSDCFGKAMMLPPTKRGDFIAIRMTGAYGEVMASAYNLRDKALVLYSDDL